MVQALLTAGDEFSALLFRRSYPGNVLVYYSVSRIAIMNTLAVVSILPYSGRLDTFPVLETGFFSGT
jgi:hypothetical protein